MLLIADWGGDLADIFQIIETKLIDGNWEGRNNVENYDVAKLPLGLLFARSQP